MKANRALKNRHYQTASSLSLSYNRPSLPSSLRNFCKAYFL